jgi:aconitate hydratase
MNRKTLQLNGTEIISIVGLDDNMKAGATIKAIIQREDGRKDEIELLSRIDTHNEIEYYRNGGILQFVLRNMMKK